VIDILLFPSSYEGYGMPCLEAMLSGVPIVCSNNSSIPEIVGDAGLMCDAENGDGFVNNIIQLLNNKNLYNQKKQQGIERAKIFSDNEKYTKNLLTIYQDVLKI
jgi:alpha-1,3-rhamnosyl/mannosyltransferase